jgi:hypothetical protein
MRTDEIRRRRLTTSAVILASLLVVGPAFAQGARPATGPPRDAKAEVTALLHEFLSNVTSAAMHQRFWADDVIYVSNAGVVRSKADILKGMKAEEPAAPAAPGGGYSAEDVVVRQFGETVVLNFRLVQHTTGQPDTSFRNSGVFVLRDGRWQVVSWQATRLAPATGQ